MADQRIEFKIVVDDTGALVGLKSTQKGVKDIDLTAKGAEESVKRLTAEMERIGNGKTVTAIKLTDTELKNLNKTLEQQKNSTGASTSAVLELGRVIQDAPYGIRGMANNLTQLVSQVSFATIAAGSFTAALKQMWKALLGPLGIVLAFSAVISILDGFYGGQKKAKEATDETTESLKKQITPLEKLINLYSSLRRVLFSESDSNAIKSYKNGLLSLDETVKVLTRNFSDFSNAYDKLTDSQKKDPEAVKALVDGYQELLQARELEQKQVERMGILRADIAKNGESISKNGLTFIRAEKTELDSLEISYVKTQKRLIELESYFAKQSQERASKSKETKPLGLPDLSGLDKYSDEYLKEIRDINKRTELENSTSNREKVKIQARYHLEELQIKQQQNLQTFDAVREDLRAKLKLYVADQVARKLMTQKEADETLTAFENNGNGIRVAMVSNFEKMRELTKNFYQDKLNNTTDIEQQITDKTKEQLDKRKADLQDYVDAFKSVLGGVQNFINGEYEREKTIEQNRTNALNEELNNRLINENLSKEQRAVIQNEIARNDEALRKKQDALARKQFETNKAFNISVATIDTAAGVARALKDYPAPASFVIGGAVAASGLLQIAAIARQKFQSTSSNTPVRTTGGGAGGAGDRSFNFNLVGNNRENQLVNAIQGKFDQPIKAYVVSRDMSNQQQLDANIVNSARF